MSTSDPPPPLDVTTLAAATDPLAPEADPPHPNRVVRALNAVPGLLSSKPHIIFLFALGIYLVLLPVAHVYTPSNNGELIGGNYTNVTSDLGACIAAGGTVHLVRRHRQSHREVVALRREVAALRSHHEATSAAVARIEGHVAGRG